MVYGSDHYPEEIVEDLRDFLGRPGGGNRC
ncbi:Uncharacterised protein [Mycobacterium tuberculosis]|nr:Uncharacterised protein [Mycobacterium tuberculosis]